MRHRTMSSPERRLILALCACMACASLSSTSHALGRERAVEQIPELMGRILESQEEIQASESELRPLLGEQDDALQDARGRIEQSSTEAEAAEALVDYVEAYDRRAELQAEGLRSIRGPIVRMRDDARDLVRAANAVRDEAPPRENAKERRGFFEDHFQGVAQGLSALGSTLGRQEEAGIAGSVLHASWASHQKPELPLVHMGPEGALAFARRAEGLYARFQARSSQLEAERRAVRQLLDLLIQRQLSERLEGLFVVSENAGVSDLFANAGLGEDWDDLGSVVSRALGLPSDAPGGGSLGSGDSLDRLDFFAHRRHAGAREE